jgi:NADH-quinone oxidoreductase subunit L
MAVRCHAIFDRSPLALSAVAIIGAATAFFAATVGIVQTDIKRVLAYSTISQLGYMFMACGVAAYSAAIFHLLTHAFFKALLFLAAGSVIHALDGEQDMREMGGLKSKIPVTYWTMTAGVLAISGIFPFAGFVSKDEILYQTFASGGIGPVLWFVGLLTAGLTSFYMFRLWYLTFFGERRSSHEDTAHSHAAETDHGVHESGGLMLFPLVVLAILSVIGGWVGWPDALGGANWFSHFLDPVISAQHLSFEQMSVAVNAGTAAAATPPASEGGKSVELLLAGVSTVVALFGWFLAYFFYVSKPALPGRLAKQFGAIYGLAVNKYWNDEIYNTLVVRPVTVFSRIILWWAIDRGLVDGAGYATAGAATGLGALARRLQSGNIRSYAGWLAGGAAVLLLLMYFGFGTPAHLWLARP